MEGKVTRTSASTSTEPTDESPTWCTIHGDTCPNTKILATILAAPPSVEIMDEDWNRFEDTVSDQQAREIINNARSQQANEDEEEKEEGSTSTEDSDAEQPPEDNWDDQPGRVQTAAEIEEDERAWARISEKIKQETLERYCKEKRDLAVEFEDDKFKLVQRYGERKRQLEDRFYGKKARWDYL